MTWFTTKHPFHLVKLPFTMLVIWKWVFSERAIPHDYNALHTYVRDKPPDNELWHFGSVTGLLAGRVQTGCIVSEILASPPPGRVALEECDDWDGEQSPVFMLGGRDFGSGTPGWAQCHTCVGLSVCLWLIATIHLYLSVCCQTSTPRFVKIWWWYVCLLSIHVDFC